MKISFFLLFFFVLISVSSCNDTIGPSIDDNILLALGEYKGTYPCIQDFGSGYDGTVTCNTEVRLVKNWYSIKQLSPYCPPRCPPRSSGDCQITSTTITFTDRTIHTDDFDHTLIIDGIYHYTFDKQKLTMSQIDTVITDTTHIRKYIYNLKLIN